MTTATNGLLLATCVLALAAGCGGDGGTADAQTGAGLPKGAEPMELDPGDFTTEIDNRYWPMKPGTRWTYRELDEDGKQQTVVTTVTSGTKRIANGITARVVRDTVRQEGEVVEDTFDWYAQDKDGNVWYFGEDTRELDARGRVKTTEGSWEAGQHGAQPGIVMTAHPEVGDSYREEYRKGVAEDRGRIIRVGETRTTPTDSYHDVVVAERTRLEPKIVEHKEYAPGIGLITENVIKGGDEKSHLARIERA
jgi:hypothetical protein